MVKKQSLKQNLAYNVIFEVVTLLFPLITAPYVSRAIGPEGIGLASYVNSITRYFVIFAMLGIAKYGNRTIAQVRDDKDKLSQTFCNLYAVQILVASLSILIFCIYFIGFNQRYRTLFLIQLIEMFSILFNINWFFYGIEKFKLTAIRGVIIRILATAAIFIFVRTPQDVWKYLAIMGGTSVISNAIVWNFLFKHVKLVKPKLKLMLPHLKPLLILFIPVIADSIFASLDKIMITLISNPTQNGLYESADKVVTMPRSIITALSAVMLPRMSNVIAKGNEEKSKIYIKDSMQFAMGAAVAMTFGLAAIGERFAPLYFGANFALSGTIIKYLSPVAIIAAWASVVRTQYLIPKEKDKIYIISVIMGAIINIILNFFFISRYGAIGAVWGTLIAEFLVMLYQSLAVRKELHFKQYLNDNFLFLIAGAIMLGSLNLLSNFLKNGYLELILMIVLGGIIYIFSTYVLFYLFKRDRLQYMLKVVFNKRKPKLLKGEESNNEESE